MHTAIRESPPTEPNPPQVSEVAQNIGATHRSNLLLVGTSGLGKALGIAAALTSWQAGDASDRGARFAGGLPAAALVATSSRVELQER